LDSALFWLKFKKACRRGNVKFFLEALERLADVADSWDLAMPQVAELPNVHPKIQNAFLNEWSKYYRPLCYRAHQDPVLERGLRALLPKSNYVGPSLKLFRGTNARECRQYGCGVSWTNRFEFARFFYCHPRWPDEGIVLTAIATPDAVLQQRQYRQGGEYFDQLVREHGREDQYIVDPSKLTDKGVVHREPPGRPGVIVRNQRDLAALDAPRAGDPIFAAITAHREAAEEYLKACKLLHAATASGRPADLAAYDASGAELWTEFTAATMRGAEMVLNSTHPTTAVGVSRLRSYFPDRFAKPGVS
jgi:hypothetical protein